MKTKYHLQITQEVLSPFFSPSALQAILSANRKQDDFWSGQIGHPYYHFDNNSFTASLNYLDKQRNLIFQTLSESNQPPLLAWQAFGRLTHAVQDFYAHSNYVKLWLQKKGVTANSILPEQVDPLDREILESRQLRSGTVYLLEYLAFIPPLAPVIKPLVPHDSHAWMNLDSPQSGPLFIFALEGAKKRTRSEYYLIASSLDPDQLALFRDQ